MKFLIATHNMKKLGELQRILSPLGIDVVTDAMVGVELTDVEETGLTFEENAVLKADSGCKESAMPCIADDSGLVTDALDGAPGIYSARFAGEHGNDAKNIEKLLFELRDVPEQKRTAAFVCTVCCTFPDGRRITAEGRCEGRIAFERRGEGGFGYDPVFLPDDAANGQTMAQLTSEEKDAISHRRRAIEKLAEELRKNTEKEWKN